MSEYLPIEERIVDYYTDLGDLYLRRAVLTFQLCVLLKVSDVFQNPELTRDQELVFLVAIAANLVGFFANWYEGTSTKKQIQTSEVMLREIQNFPVVSKPRPRTELLGAVGRLGFFLSPLRYLPSLDD